MVIEVWFDDRTEYVVTVGTINHKTLIFDAFAIKKYFMMSGRMAVNDRKPFGYHILSLSRYISNFWVLFAEAIRFTIRLLRKTNLFQHCDDQSSSLSVYSRATAVSVYVPLLTVSLCRVLIAFGMSHTCMVHSFWRLVIWLLGAAAALSIPFYPPQSVYLYASR